MRRRRSAPCSTSRCSSPRRSGRSAAAPASLASPTPAARRSSASAPLRVVRPLRSLPPAQRAVEEVPVMSINPLINIERRQTCSAGSGTMTCTAWCRPSSPMAWTFIVSPWVDRLVATVTGREFHLIFAGYPPLGMPLDDFVGALRDAGSASREAGLVVIADPRGLDLARRMLGRGVNRVHSRSDDHRGNRRVGAATARRRPRVRLRAPVELTAAARGRALHRPLSHRGPVGDRHARQLPDARAGRRQPSTSSSRCPARMLRSAARRRSPARQIAPGARVRRRRQVSSPSPAATRNACRPSPGLVAQASSLVAQASSLVAQAYQPARMAGRMPTPQGRQDAYPTRQPGWLRYKASRMPAPAAQGDDFSFGR